METPAPAESPRYSNRVPFPTRNLFEAGVVEVAVPPFARGKIPETSVVRITAGWLVRRPVAEDLTNPAPRLVMVVEAEAVSAPVTFKVESKLAAPVTCSSAPKEVCPVTERVPEAIVAPVPIERERQRKVVVPF